MGKAARAVIAVATVTVLGYVLAVLSTARSDAARAMSSKSMVVSYAQRAATLDPVKAECVIGPSADIESFVAKSAGTCPVIQLSNGAYTLASKDSIEIQRPVVLQGESRDGVIVLPTGSDHSAPPMINIASDDVVLRNFTIAGMAATSEIAAIYDSDRGDHMRQRLIGVQYTADGVIADPVSDVRIEFVTLRFAGRECVRIKNSARNVYVTDSAIDHCGGDIFNWAGNWREEFEPSGQIKSTNGEGIYIGSDLDKQTSAPDAPSRIRIERNAINTFGAECVDAKEGATDVLIRHNICANSGYAIESKRRFSGLISIQGNSNAVIGNALCAAHDGPGAKREHLAGYGVQISNEGGFGRANTIRNNLLSGPTQSAFRISQGPQSEVCGNTVFTSAPLSTGLYGQDVSQPCAGANGAADAAAQTQFEAAIGPAVNSVDVLAAVCAGRVVSGTALANGFELLGLIDPDAQIASSQPTVTPVSVAVLPKIPLQLATLAPDTPAPQASPFQQATVTVEASATAQPTPTTQPTLTAQPTLTTPPTPTGIPTQTPAPAATETAVPANDATAEPVPEAEPTTDAVATTASAQSTDESGEFDLEAERATLTAPLATGSDRRASGGQFVHNPQGQSLACDAAGTGAWAEFNIETQSGDFALWIRSNTGGAARDYYCVQIDNKAPLLLNLRGGTGWRWRKQSSLAIALNAGAHTLRIRPLRPGTKFDRIFLSADATASPK